MGYGFATTKSFDFTAFFTRRTSADPIGNHVTHEQNVARDSRGNLSADLRS